MHRTSRLTVRLGLPIIGALALIGCRGASPERAYASAPLPLATEMPRVTLVSITGDPSAAPNSTYSPIRVGPQGDVLMSEIPGEPGLLRVVDSTGRLRRAFGRSGAGPGEALGPAPLALTDSSALAFDTRTLRISEWDSAGRILGMLTSSIAVNPVAEAADGRWIAAGTSSSRAPVVLDPRTLEARQLLPDDDSSYRSLRPPASDPHSVLPPVLGVWSGGFIVGNGATYRLALYDWSGRLRHTLARDLPANYPTALAVAEEVNQVRSGVDMHGQHPGAATLTRVAARAKRTPRDWFSHVSPLGLDQQGRIWVAGPEGDSAYVDVFTAERFLGRMHLPCRQFANRWAMRGRWLALICAPDDEAFEADAVVKLFRVDEAR